MLAWTNSPAQAHAQWPLLRRFGPIGLQEWSFWLTDLKLLKGWPQDMLSCYVPYNFPEADPERIEELRVLWVKKRQGDEREYLLDQLNKCLSGRMRNQTLHTLAGPVASNGKSTLFNLVSRAFGTDYYCNMPATYLTQKSPQATYPDFMHHIHRGCIQASRSGSTFLHPDFCGTGAFGAGLITLDGPMPTFLDHVCLQALKISSNNGAACSRASK